MVAGLGRSSDNDQIGMVGGCNPEELRGRVPRVWTNVSSTPWSRARSGESGRPAPRPGRSSFVGLPRRQQRNRQTRPPPWWQPKSDQRTRRRCGLRVRRFCRRPNTRRPRSVRPSIPTTTTALGGAGRGVVHLVSSMGARINFPSPGVLACAKERQRSGTSCDALRATGTEPTRDGRCASRCRQR